MPTHTHSLYRRPAQLLALVILLTLHHRWARRYRGFAPSPHCRGGSRAGRAWFDRQHSRPQDDHLAETRADSEETRQVNGMGTGVVIDPRGYIITNFHVIEGVRRIQVTTWEGKTYVARQVARDPRHGPGDHQDRRGSQELPLIRIGTSSDLMPGEPVIAVGNAYGYHNTVTRASSAR